MDKSQSHMDLNEIQSLIKFVAKSGVSEVELETKGFKIVIKTGKEGKATEQILVQAPLPVAQPAQQVVQSPAPAPAPAASAPAEAKKPAEADESKYYVFKSPMIGTFYRSPGPDKPSFVNVGDEVNSGKVLCIIEAMKLFNEIECDISGKIVKVLVDDAKPVEYDQPLFLIDPA